jgi:PAS fold.
MGDMSNPVSTETRQSLRDRLSTLEAENADLRRDLARQRDELEEFIDLLQEMEHFFEAAREPFAILHGDGRFRRVNKALLKVLGLDRLEARGATLFDFVSEDDRKYLQELFSTRDERFLTVT